LIFSRERESNRPPQWLNAAGVGDLLKHPFHHAGPSVIRSDARLNHSFSADHIEMDIVPSVLRNRGDRTTSEFFRFLPGMDVVH
jgi:hypothetical protein